jgi:hypothetical protein
VRLEGGELVGEIGKGGVMVAEGGGVSLGRERRWWLGERAQWQGGDGVSPRPACRILASGCVVAQRIDLCAAASIQGPPRGGVRHGISSLWWQ